jgi:hypothetical protein
MLPEIAVKTRRAAGSRKKVTPGSDPYLVESNSRRVEDRFLAATGTSLKIGAGFVATAIPSAGQAIASALGGASGASALAFGAIAPLYVVSTVALDIQGRKQVKAGFERRRLPLPMTLQPGERREGSLFFSIAPGPRELTLQCATATEKPVATVPLNALASLRLTQ